MPFQPLTRTIALGSHLELPTVCAEIARGGGYGYTQEGGTIRLTKRVRFVTTTHLFWLDDGGTVHVQTSAVSAVRSAVALSVLIGLVSFGTLMMNVQAISSTSVLWPGLLAMVSFFGTLAVGIVLGQASQARLRSAANLLDAQFNCASALQPRGLYRDAGPAQGVRIQGAHEEAVEAEDIGHRVERR